MTDETRDRPANRLPEELGRTLTVLRELERRGERATAARLACEIGWTEEKARQRLLVVTRITAEVIRWSGAPLHVVKDLPLGRLLDAARKRTPQERAICLSIAATGRRPAWVDRGEDPSLRPSR
jgi:hypothetical protein